MRLAATTDGPRPRPKQERVISAQTLCDALVHMVDVADRDLISHRLRFLPRR
jgi:hypothetical protein